VARIEKAYSSFPLLNFSSTPAPRTPETNAIAEGKSNSDAVK